MAEDSLPQTPPSYELLVGLAAFAGWTTSRSTVPRRMGWVNWLGVGILPLFFSISSPDDDAFQQELIRPTLFSASVSWHPKVAQRGPLVDLWINAFAAPGDPVRALRTSRSVVMDQPLDRLTHFQAPISIHSPPMLPDVLAISILFLVIAVSVLCLFGGISHCKSRTPPFLV